MRSFTYIERIDRTPEQVFAFMTDLRNAPRWRSLVRKMEVERGEALREGVHLLVTIDVMGQTRIARSELWAYEPPRRIGFRNEEQNITGEFEYVLDPVAGGTEVVFRCDIRPKGLMWLLLPFILRGNRTRYRDQLQRLKAEVEGRSTHQPHPTNSQTASAENASVRTSGGGGPKPAPK
jgi:uncharacterized protein YndB with AHSA1/START domain